MDDNECAFCGTNINDMNGDVVYDMSDVVRQIFVEEDEDDAMSPTRSPPQRGSASLRDLLSLHPPFKKTRHVESFSPRTLPTANTSPASLSPASLSPKLTKTPSSTLERGDYFAKTPSLIIERGDYTEEYACDVDLKKKENALVLNTMGHPIQTSSIHYKTRTCSSISFFLMILSMVIMLCTLLPRSSTSNGSDGDMGNTEPPSQFVGGTWVEL
jgi:hypothetical protein